jgi:hypothetical protein
MASLNGTKIKDTYPGLIKTDDNAAVGATEKQLTDGSGNAIPLTLGTAGVSFTGDVDFTSATVTGLPADTTYDLASVQNGADVDVTLTGSDASVDTVKLVAGTNITLTDTAGSITIDAAGGAAAGLVAGGDTNSMKSAAALTTIAATTTGINSIALGNNAQAAYGSISIGNQTLSSGYTFADVGGIAIGDCARAGALNIAIGAKSISGAQGGVVIGAAACNTGGSTAAVLIGCSTRGGNGSTVVGAGANGGTNSGGTVFGFQACTTAFAGTAIGYQAKSTGACSASLGFAACATGVESVALGYGVIATRANAVSMKELELQTAGGGIWLKSPNENFGKLTLTDNNILAIGGDIIPANDTATPTVLNRIWSGTQAQYDALGSYDANTIYYTV